MAKSINVIPEPDIIIMAVSAPIWFASIPTVKIQMGPKPMQVAKTPITRLRFSGGVLPRIIADYIEPNPDKPKPPIKSKIEELTK